MKKLQQLMLKITNNTSKKLSLIDKTFINPYETKEIKEVSEELKQIEIKEKKTKKEEKKKTNKVKKEDKKEKKSKKEEKHTLLLFSNRLTGKQDYYGI